MPDALSQTQEFERLMSDLAEGSEAAAWRIAEVYTPHILKAVRASLPAVIRPKIDSQDFAQAVWASLLLKRSYLARLKTPQQLVGLLAATARHKVIDAYRHYAGTEARNVRNERSLADIQRATNDVVSKASLDRGLAGRDPSPSQMASLREQWHRLLEQSSARDRRILALRIKGDTYGTISEKMGVSHATVRRVLDRLIDQFRQ